MDNQHRKITGYRELSAEEIATMNDIKTRAREVGEMIERLMAMPGLDHRCVAIAKTELQTGFMWAVRAVAQPTSF